MANESDVRVATNPPNAPKWLVAILSVIKLVTMCALLLWHAISAIVRCERSKDWGTKQNKTDIFRINSHLLDSCTRFDAYFFE